MGLQEKLLFMILGVVVERSVDLAFSFLFKEKYMTIKKKAWKWLRPPMYEIGIDRHYKILERRLRYEEFKRIIDNIVKSKYTNYEWRGTEVHLTLERSSRHPIEVYIKPIGDESNLEAFHSIIIESKTITNYNKIKDDFLDLFSSLTSVERELLGVIKLQVGKTAIKIKIENLTKLDGILKEINAERMFGEIKDSKLWFEYYDKYIQISGEVSSESVNWLKNLVTYLG